MQSPKMKSSTLVKNAYIDPKMQIFNRNFFREEQPLPAESDKQPISIQVGPSGQAMHQNLDDLHEGQPLRAQKHYAAVASPKDSFRSRSRSLTPRNFGDSYTVNIDENVLQSKSHSVVEPAEKHWFLICEFDFKWSK